MTSSITPDPGQPASLPDNVSRTTFGRISLVLGIVSWIIVIILFNLHPDSNIWGLGGVLFFVVAFVTIVFGHLGLGKGEKQRGTAVIGLILGYLELLGVILFAYVASQCC